MYLVHLEAGLIDLNRQWFKSSNKNKKCYFGPLRDVYDTFLIGILIGFHI